MSAEPAPQTPARTDVLKLTPAAAAAAPKPTKVNANAVTSSAFFDGSARRLLFPLRHDAMENEVVRAVSVSRFFGLLRANKDIIVLPSDRNLKPLVDVYRMNLGLTDASVVWVPSPYSSEDTKTVGDYAKIVAEAVQKALEGAAEDPWVMVPINPQSPLVKEVVALVKGMHVVGRQKEPHSFDLLYSSVLKADEPVALDPMLQYVDSVEDVEYYATPVEKLMLSRGYVCKSSKQLLMAYRALAEGKSVCSMDVCPRTPLYATAMTRVENTEELRMYDFPHGPVLLRRHLSVDRTGEEDLFPGLVRETVVCWTSDSETNQLSVLKPFVDAWIINGQVVCYMPLQINEKRYKELDTVAQLIIDYCNTHKLKNWNDPGMFGTFTFSYVNGAAVLAHSDNQQINDVWAAMMTARRFAGESKTWAMFRSTPHSSVDIFTFWHRLVEGTPEDTMKDVRPFSTETGSGVLPVVYQPGLVGWFFASAESREQLRDWRDQCDAFLREEAEEAEVRFRNVRIGSKKTDHHRFWCFPGSGISIRGEGGERQNLPLPVGAQIVSSALSVLCASRSPNDFAVVPDIPQVREFVDFFTSTFGIKSSRMLYYGAEDCNYAEQSKNTAQVVRETTAMAGFSTAKDVHESLFIPRQAGPAFRTWVSDSLAGIDVTSAAYTERQSVYKMVHGLHKHPLHHCLRNTHQRRGSLSSKESSDEESSAPQTPQQPPKPVVVVEPEVFVGEEFSGTGEYVCSGYVCSTADDVVALYNILVAKSKSQSVSVFWRAEESATTLPLHTLPFTAQSMVTLDSEDHALLSAASILSSSPTGVVTLWDAQDLLQHSGAYTTAGPIPAYRMFCVSFIDGKLRTPLLEYVFTSHKNITTFGLEKVDSKAPIAGLDSTIQKIRNAIIEKLRCRTVCEVDIIVPVDDASKIIVVDFRCGTWSMAMCAQYSMGSASSAQPSTEDSASASDSAAEAAATPAEASMQLHSSKCWRIVSCKSVTRMDNPTHLWTLWNRLRRNDVAYIPGRSTRGILPVAYNTPNAVNGVFLLFGRDSDDVSELLTSLDRALRPSKATATSPRMIEAFEYSTFRRSDFIRSATRDRHAEEQLPTHVRVWTVFDPACVDLGLCSMTLLHPEVDLAVMGVHDGDESNISQFHGVDDFWDFCRTVFGYDPHQFVSTADCGRVDELAKNMHDSILTSAGGAEQSANVLYVPNSLSTRVLETLSSVGLPERCMTNIFGDSSAIGPQSASLGIRKLYRSITEKDTPTAFETMIGTSPRKFCSCGIPNGFVCSSREELELAYQELGRPEEWWLMVAPFDQPPLHLRGVEGISMLTVSISEDSPAVVTTSFDVKVSENGLQQFVNVPFVGKSVLIPDGTALMDRIVVGNANAGYRRSSCDQKTQRALLDISKALMRQWHPTGPGTLSFIVCEDGQIQLLAVQYGRFTDLHYGMLFLERHALDLADEVPYAMLWRCVPPPGVDVWTLWTRMMDRNVAFVPGRSSISQAGVFPLAFRKERMCLLLAVAENDDELHQVKHVTDELLYSVAATGTAVQQITSFHRDDLRRIWVQSARPEYRRLSQRINLANRSLALTRPGKDICILPGEFPEVHEYANFVSCVMDLDEEQILFTRGDKGYIQMDRELVEDDELLTTLKRIVTLSPEGPEGWVLIPYTITDDFEKWSAPLQRLGVNVVGERHEWIERYGHKGILHRHANTPDKPSVLEELGIGVGSAVRVPRGFTCDSVDDLVLAFRKLDCPKVVLKPVFGAAGEGILFIDSEEALKVYDFPMGQVALEECLDLDRGPDGVIISPAIHYMESRIFGDGPDRLVDQIMTGTSYAGWRRTVVTSKFADAASRMIKAIIQRLNPTGPGGFDFLSQKGRPYLTDVNTGRFNGAHFPKMFIKLWGGAPAPHWIVWKRKPKEALDLRILFHRMWMKNVALIPGSENRRGVFPLIYARGRSGQFIAIGRDEVDITNKRATVDTMLQHDPADDEKALLAAWEGRPWRDVILEIMNGAPSAGPATMPRVSLTLFKGANAIYAPEIVTGANNVLVGGDKILALLNPQEAAVLEPLCAEVIDCTGCVLAPGIVDIHAHLSGGGGEAGPASRTPEAHINELLEGGVTTVIGVLGTDSITRSLVNLQSKVRGLCAEGITAFMYTGAYQVPPPTITGSVSKDIALIEQVIGVGEIAISEHRGSQPTLEELAKVASEARVGGMLGGKAGVMYCHIGDMPTLLGPLFQLIDETHVPIQTILPTHCHRSAALIADAKKWVQRGGYVDFTCRAAAATKAIVDYFNDGNVDMTHVIASSDAYGSLPIYDAGGNLVQYRVADAAALLRFIQRLYFQEGWPMERILPLCTSNPASFLQLKQKGTIRTNMDADLMVLDELTLKLKYVCARGRILKRPDSTYTGFFTDASVNAT